MVKKPFLDHLEDLRWTLLKIGFAVLVATMVMFFFAPQLLQFVSWPLQSIDPTDKTIALRTLRPASGFVIAVKLSFLCGFLVSLPLVLYFLAQFFIPALKAKERKRIKAAFGFGGILFVAGTLFCYFVALPLTLKFLWGYTERLNLANEWTIEYYVSFVVGLVLVFGLAFELPVLVLGLVQASILTPEFLRQKRPYAILIIVIFAAVATPPDVVSQILVAVPMLLLYEACVWTAKFIKK